MKKLTRLKINKDIMPRNDENTRLSTSIPGNGYLGQHTKARTASPRTRRVAHDIRRETHTDGAG